MKIPLIRRERKQSVSLSMESNNRQQCVGAKSSKAGGGAVRDTESEVASFVAGEQRRQRYLQDKNSALQKSKPVSASNDGKETSRFPTQADSHRVHNNIDQANEGVPLRRKQKFYIRSNDGTSSTTHPSRISSKSSAHRQDEAGDIGGSQESLLPNSSSINYLAQLQEVQQAIRDGKLERSVPPAKGSVSSRAFVSRPRHRTALHAHGSESQYTGFSDDVDLQLASSFAEKPDVNTDNPFQPQATETVARTTIAPPNLYSLDCYETDSDESFRCDWEMERNHKSLTELDINRQIDKEGTSPWVDIPKDKCRLCGIKYAGHLRGLCHQCHNHSKPKRDELQMLSRSDTVKPPAPLKGKYRATGLQSCSLEDVAKSLTVSPSTVDSTLSKDYSENPQIVDDCVKVRYVAAETRPQVVDSKRMRTDQVESKREPADHSQISGGRQWWEGMTMNDNIAIDQSGESQHGQMRRRKGSGRRGSFYEFYDDIFKGRND